MSKSKIPAIILAVIVLIPVLLPLKSSYVRGTADGLAHRFRQVSFIKTIDEGNLRPRWIDTQALGFGVPLFLLNYLLPYYSVYAFVKAGFNLNSSVAIYQALTILLSFSFMYLFSSKLWGKMAGLCAAILYTYAPYHLLTIYIYEGWGELTAFVFPPLILFLFLKLKNTLSGMILISIAWLLLIISHNISFMIYTPIIFLTAAILTKFDFRSMGFYVLSFIQGIILSSFFLLPALY